MTVFTDINGNLLDPQPTLKDVLRDRIAHAQSLLNNEFEYPIENYKNALLLLTEINNLIINAQVLKSLEGLNRFNLDTNNEVIEYPRDLFNLMILKGSPYAFYLFEWVDYHNTAKLYRLKTWHDIKLFDGTIIECVWPNASSFGNINEKDVEFIRLSKKRFPGQREWKHPKDRVKDDEKTTK